MNREELENLLIDMAKEAPARVSFLWQGMEEKTPWACYEPEKIMVSASTIKTMLMMALLERVMKGEISLEDTVTVTEDMILSDSKFFEQGPGVYKLDEILRFMITRSDNSCTNIIIHMLGMQQANEYFASIGLTETKLERVMLDFDAIKEGRNNYTSARDQFAVYEMLYHHKVLTPELCELALSILMDNRDYDLFYRYLPRNLKVAHKSGGLDCLSHDSGIFYLPGNEFYLGIFVSDGPSDVFCDRLIGAMTRKIWDYLEA